MRGKKTDDNAKAAVISALLAGQIPSEIAKTYELPESTVRDIRKGLTSDQFAEIRAKKDDELAGLIEGHLHTSLEAAANIARQTSNAGWLDKQSAEDLGVFYGILTDKAVRILEAAEAASPRSEEWPDEVTAVR